MRTLLNAMPTFPQEARAMYRSVVGSPKILSVMLTFTCPAACKDCGTLSSPKAKGSLQFEEVVSYIEQASDEGFELVVFTGGEATLQWRTLLKSIAFAKSKDLNTRLVTNAHWANRADVAKDKVLALVNSGLDEINFSTGDEHVRFIPLERVLRAASLSILEGLGVNIMVEKRLGNGLTKSIVASGLRHFLHDNKLKSKISIIESPWMPLDHHEVSKHSDSILLNKDNYRLHCGCESVLSTYTLQGDGSVLSCCGIGSRTVPELAYKKGESLNEVVRDSEVDLVKLALHYLGPAWILHWAALRDDSIEWENRYAHPCQACMHVYKEKKVREAIVGDLTAFERAVTEAMHFDERIFRRAMSAKNRVTV